MRIALLHFNFLNNDIKKNTSKIIQSMSFLKNKNIDMILTPELALTGYGKSPEQLPHDTIIETAILEIEKSVCKHKIPLLLGTIYKDEFTKRTYNSCLYLKEDKITQNIHNKLIVLPTESEKWADKGTSLKTFNLHGINFGVLICADIWIDTNAYILSQKGADYIIVLAAWSKGMGSSPEQSLLRSNIASSCPIILINQTGSNTQTNLHNAHSMYFRKKEIEIQYNGPEAILVLDIEAQTGKLITKEINYI